MGMVVPTITGGVVMSSMVVVGNLVVRGVENVETGVEMEEESESEEVSDLDTPPPPIVGSEQVGGVLSVQTEPGTAQHALPHGVSNGVHRP